MRTLVVVLLAWASMSTVLVLSPPVAVAERLPDPQPPGAVERLSRELALARLCVNESGLRAYLWGDCAAIHAVVEWRQHHVPAYRGDTYVEALHRYSGRATVDRRGRNRPWIAQLQPFGARPSAYCARCRWRGRGELWWSRTFQHAREVLRGDVRAPCRPHSWARSDVRPPRRWRPVRVDCGRTLNTFWRIPAYAARWPDA